MKRRLLAARLLWCGASSSSVGPLLIVLELAIHKALYSLLHDIGRLGYGRYALFARPQRHLFATQLQKYVAHIQPVVAHITALP